MSISTRDEWDSWAEKRDAREMRADYERELRIQDLERLIRHTKLHMDPAQWRVHSYAIAALNGLLASGQDGIKGFDSIVSLSWQYAEFMAAHEPEDFPKHPDLDETKPADGGVP